MIVKTLFLHNSRFSQGEVEITLMPGIPQLHVVGQPDAHIRECGLKLKSALRACGLQWPKGNQIVVNLRPAHFRKSSAGADLAIALGFMAMTGQLNPAVKALLAQSVIYGEVALDGKVFAPPDLPRALIATDQPLLTGVCERATEVRDGKWMQLGRLNDSALTPVDRKFDWAQFWRPPPLPALSLHAEAAEALILASHLNLNVLVGGPQGSGKTTWARALHALTPVPDPEQTVERQALFGEETPADRWRPCETPHHSISPLAMIGGGAPLFPGVISRAHGGLLVMDEFLEFHPEVLEALREPLERGYVEIARKGERRRFPARFQLIGTSNLCPCGKLNPGSPRACSYGLTRCRSVCARLSGPVMDRFDMLVFSHRWLGKGRSVKLTDLQATLRQLAAFAAKRGPVRQKIPRWVQELELSHRRRNSLLRLARGLADLRGRSDTDEAHFHEAYQRVVVPMHSLAQLFA